MKEYVDFMRRRYKVMPYRPESAYPMYRARYCWPGEDKWYGVLELPTRTAEKDAQDDLDKMAKKEGWKVYEGRV